jgi:hypothetical protein
LAIDEVLELRTAGEVESLGDEKGVEDDDSRRTVILSPNVDLLVNGRLIGMISEKLLESDDDAGLSIWGCAGVEPMGLMLGSALRKGFGLIFGTGE